MIMKGKTVLITGSAGGIGQATARLFAAEGADLALWDAVKTDTAGLGAGGRKITSAEVDISDPAAVEKEARTLDDAFGRIDVLVNNAGITRDNILFRMKPEEWDLVLKVNLGGAFHCTKAVGRIMARRKEGSIVNISSVVGLRGNAGQANYSASKSGLIGLTKSAARELARFNVRVNAIAPGYIRTPMTDRLTEEQKKNILEAIPMKTLGTPEDVARAVLFFASGLSAYVTGTVLAIDGGFAM